MNTLPAFSSRGLPHAVCILVFCLCLGAGTAKAEDLTYTGNAGDLTIGTIGGSNNTDDAGGTTLPGSVFPVASESGNTVTVNNTTGINHPWRVFGGLSNSAAVSGNTVNLLSGTVRNNLYGGYDAAAMSGLGAYNNTVNISGGTVTGNALAGISLNGDVTDNRITLSGGEVGSHLYGGSANGAGNAENNKVTASGGTVKGNIFGGNSNSGSATRNNVTISGSAVGDPANLGTGWVYGGYSDLGLVSDNSVIMSAGSVNSLVGAYSESDDSSNNQVTLSGGTVRGSIRGGNSNTGAVTNNSVVVSGGYVENGVYGGFNYGSGGNVSDNNVVISGGTFGSYFGVYGGFTDYGNATGNSVTISESVAGNFDVVYGGYSNGGAASNNSVAISGGIFRPNSVIYGGLSSSGYGSGDTINNSVTISGRPDLAEATLFGGYTDATHDAFTGNTLNVNGFTGAVGGTANFQNYNFLLPASLSNGGTVLTITGGQPTDLAGTNVVITGIEKGAQIFSGSSIILISDTQNSPASFTGSNILQGISRIYDFSVNTLGDALNITVDSVRSNPQLKSLSEGKLAGLAFVNQGADLIMGPGMFNLLSATQRQNLGLAPFMAFSGGTSRYNTGSHIDVNGFSLLAGLGWRAPLQTGSLVTGAFFEAGWGNYDSRNSFNNLPSVKGKGDLSYYGGGILGRYEAPVGPGGLYGEASFRAGRVDTDFRSNDILNANNEKVDYDSGSAYFGAHLGAGCVWKITDEASLDFSTKYIWTHQGSDSVSISGDTVKFKDIDSQRWRSGARFSYTVNDLFTPYAGAYYDHEFGGKARATTYGYSIDAPDLKGGTGIGELGFTLTPSATLPLSFDLGVQGYVGQREGVTGSLQVKYEF